MLKWNQSDAGQAERRACGKLVLGCERCPDLELTSPSHRAAAGLRNGAGRWGPGKNMGNLASSRSTVYPLRLAHTMPNALVDGDGTGGHGGMARRLGPVGCSGPIPSMRLVALDGSGDSGDFGVAGNSGSSGGSGDSLMTLAAIRLRRIWQLRAVRWLQRLRPAIPALPMALFAPAHGSSGPSTLAALAAPAIPGLPRCLPMSTQCLPHVYPMST